MAVYDNFAEQLGSWWRGAHEWMLNRPPLKVPQFATKEGWVGRRLAQSGGGRALMDWGWKGVGAAAGEGAAAAFGFFKTPEGTMRFLGGDSFWRTLRGTALGAGVGYAVYKATDNPLLGIGAGVGAMWATKAKLRGALKLAAPAFTLYAMYEGYKQEGVWGAVKGGVKEAAIFAAFDIGLKAVTTAFSGSSIGTLAGGVGRLAMNPWTIGAVALGAGAYYGAKKLAEIGRESRRTEFVGDMAAFTTEAGHTMRQRALGEISRSHTNSRTILGNEAQLMHF